MSIPFQPRHPAAGAFALLLAIPIFASAAGAQLPAAWLQTSGGLGFAGRRNDYDTNVDFTGQVRGGIKLASMVGVELSGLVTTPVVTGHKVTNAICVIDIANPGICLPQPTPVSFTMSGASASLVYGRGNDKRLSIGAGSYVLAKYTSIGSSTRALAIVAGADVDLFRTHPTITVGVHPILMPNVRGTYEWFLPFDVGLRAW